MSTDDRALRSAPDPLFAPSGQVRRTKRDRAAPIRHARGFPGAGGGSATVIDPVVEYRGTSVQVCGLWPFSIGATSPVCGVPLGRHLHTGAVVTGDPISFFQRAKLISNPSAFVLGLPGLGKSSLVRHIATGLAGYGVTPMIVADLKGEYRDLIEALEGDVLRIGPGQGHLNVLDPGASREAAQRILKEADRLDVASDEAARAGNTADAEVLAARAETFAKKARALVADAHARSLTLVAALVAIVRKDRGLDPREWAIVDAALRVLEAERGRTPVLRDVLRVIRDRHETVRAVALDRGDDARYLDITEELEASLVSLVEGGRLGDTFTEQTTVRASMTRAIVFDVSAIDDSDKDLQAAALLACWSQGFAAVEVSHTLADLGLEPRRHFMVILDELWRALRSGPEMVDLVDGVTRVNRTLGVGQIMISHTISDLLALPSEAERMKAKGFVERAGMIFLGGLPPAEMQLLRSVFAISRAEEQLLTEWQQPPAWDALRGQEGEPPGRGKFLLKVGGRPGIPFRVQLTPEEIAVNDTNQRWHEEARS